MEGFMFTPRTRASRWPVARSGVGFWGLLLGSLFLVPLAGWAVGAGVGARLGYLKEQGIGEDFQRQVPGGGHVTCPDPRSR